MIFNRGSVFRYTVYKFGEYFCISRTCEILSEAPGNQPHREISHTGSRPKDAEYLSSSSDGDLSDNDSQAELRLARAKREREISPGNKQYEIVTFYVILFFYLSLMQYN